MKPVNERLLDERLAELESARPWSPRLVSKIEQLIRTGEDEELIRINPLRFSVTRAVSEPEAVDLFLFASRTGLFEMNWHLMCPGCGAFMESFRHLQSVTSRYHCDL